MKQEENKYFRLKNHFYHPDNDGKIAFFFLFISRFIVEQFIILRYLKDLIFSSGLFFVPQCLSLSISEVKNQSRTNHIGLYH